MKKINPKNMEENAELKKTSAFLGEYTCNVYIIPLEMKQLLRFS